MSFNYVKIHVLGGLSFEEFVNLCIGAFWGGPKRILFVCGLLFHLTKYG